MTKPAQNANETHTDADQAFVRDELTLFGYFLMGAWAYLWAGFGVYVPHLRDEMHLSCSMSALHFSALALGPLLSGILGYRILSRAGKPAAVAAGTLVMLSGGLMVALCHNLFATIAAAFLVGFGGAIMGQGVISSLSERFLKNKAVGIAECNIAGSLFSMASPLVHNLVIYAGLSWRTAVILPTIAFTACFLHWRKLPNLYQNTSPNPVPTPDKQNSALPAGYWLYFVIVFLSVAAEWGVVFWCSEFISRTLNTADQGTAMTVFLSGMLCGRIGAGFLVRRFPTGVLLRLATGVAACAFLSFWLARSLPVNLVSLFLLGLAESNVYPLCLTESLDLVHREGGSQTEATARMSISTGGATLFAPLCLGILCDRVGMAAAMGLVAGLLGLAFAGVLVAQTRVGAVPQNNSV